MVDLNSFVFSPNQFKHCILLSTWQIIECPFIKLISKFDLLFHYQKVYAKFESDSASVMLYVVAPAKSMSVVYLSLSQD